MNARTRTLRYPALLAALLLTVSLGCSLSGLGDSAKSVAKTKAAGLAVTAVAKGENFAQTKAAGLADAARARIQTGAPELRDAAVSGAQTQGPGLAEAAQVAVRTAGPELYASLVREVERPRILNRARAWADAGVSYDPAFLYEGYRTDAAGYVAYAWFLVDGASEPVSPDAAGIASAFAAPVDFAELQPGDAVGNQRPGDEGFIVLFDGWQDDTRTRFDAYLLGGPAWTASRMTLTLMPDASGGVQLAETDGIVPGPFFALRRSMPE